MATITLTEEQHATILTALQTAEQLVSDDWGSQHNYLSDEEEEGLSSQLNQITEARALAERITSQERPPYSLMIWKQVTDPIDPAGWPSNLLSIHLDEESVSPNDEDDTAHVNVVATFRIAEGVTQTVAFDWADGNFLYGGFWGKDKSVLTIRVNDEEPVCYRQADLATTILFDDYTAARFAWDTIGYIQEHFGGYYGSPEDDYDWYDDGDDDEDGGVDELAEEFLLNNAVMEGDTETYDAIRSAQAARGDDD